jgi:cytoskeletal protein RodZ
VVEQLPNNTQRPEFKHQYHQKKKKKRRRRRRRKKKKERKKMKRRKIIQSLKTLVMGMYNPWKWRKF